MHSQRWSRYSKISSRSSVNNQRGFTRLKRRFYRAGYILCRMRRIVATMGISLLILTPVFLHADEASDLKTRINAVLPLLLQLQKLLKDKQALQQTVTTQASAPVCETFSRSLLSGSEGDDVARLQQILKKGGFYGGDLTGYFGPATEVAVRDWQVKNGVVSSGSAGTTGWGVFGKKSQAVISKPCAPAQTPTSVRTPVQLSVRPIEGTYPLVVELSIKAESGTYSVEFGDGSAGPIVVPKTSCVKTSCTSIVQTMNHTYERDGIYIPVLRPFFTSCPVNEKCDVPPAQTFPRITVRKPAHAQ